MKRFLEIVPGTASFLALGALVFFSWKAPVWVVIFIVLYDLYWFLKVLYLFFHLRTSFSILKKNLAKDWFQELTADHREWGNLYHLVVLPMYKESFEVVHKSFESLAAANYDLKRMIVVLALEERGGEGDREIAGRITAEFGPRFHRFFVSTHPDGIPGELAGKGANETWAVKAAKQEVIDAELIPYDRIIVSVFDIDTRPGRDYFAILAYKFLSTPDRLRASYQPVPLFTNNFYHASIFPRLIGFSATFWQLMQQSRREQLVTFSSHSISFRALVDLGYWHTDIVSEDSRIFFQALIHYKGEWQTVPLLYPVYMDAVEGDSFFGAMKNLYKQQRRWAWGVENFPYVVSEFIRRKDIPFRVKRFWTLKIFDGFFSWSTSSFIIFLFGVMPNWLGDEAFKQTVYSYNLPLVTGWLINLSSIGIITSAFLSMHFLPPKEAEARPRLKEYVFYFLQWFFMPVTFVVFGSVPAFEAQLRLMFGGKYRLGFWKTPKGARS
jgi:hypothetical protein